MHGEFSIFVPKDITIGQNTTSHYIKSKEAAERALNLCCLHLSSPKVFNASLKVFFFVAVLPPKSKRLVHIYRDSGLKRVPAFCSHVYAAG